MASPGEAGERSWRKGHVFAVRRRDLSSGRGLSLVPNPGVEVGVEQVDQEVVDQDEGGKEEVDARDHRIVTVRQRRDEQRPQSGQVEQRLDDHRAPHQDRHLQSDEGDHRDQRVLHGVADDNQPLAQPLGPRRPDVVLPQHLQHHGARHPHGGGRRGRPQNQAGDDEYADVGQRILAEFKQSERGRPAPPDAGKDEDHEAQPEVGGGQPEDGDAAPDIIAKGVLAHRRVDADRQRDHQADDQRRRRQLQGNGHSLEDLPLHGRQVPLQGLTERTAQEDPRHPAHIRYVDWDVQSQHHAQPLPVDIGPDELRVTQQDVDVVAGEQAHRQEHQHAQDEQRRNEQQQPPNDVGTHGASSTHP